LINYLYQTNSKEIMWYLIFMIVYTISANLYIHTKNNERRPISMINVCTNSTGLVSTVFPQPIHQYI
jgi:hypothetical protein